MWLQHFRLWFSVNWLKLIAMLFGLGLMVMVIYGIYCFQNLESYYRTYMFASVPIQIPIALLHTGLFFLGYFWMFRTGSGMTQDSKAIPPEKLNIYFSDVIGIDEARDECMEVVDLIKDRQRVKMIGGKIIKGLLMMGPPGCGKTMLAKAIACESKIPFLATAGSEFNEMYVGVGASRVRKLFANARQYAKIYGSCIIFIDEIDAIARGRQFAVGSGGGETNATQNQLLVEMDGLNKGTGASIIVIGATNAPIESLDEALLRPGRFDRKIMIDRPYADGRNEIFKYYLSKVKYDPTLDTMRVANYVIGSSPADIASIVQEAALICTREKRTVIEMRDLTAAIERIHLGQERKRKVHPLELQKTAYHESGHAILLYYLHPIDDVFKVSVATRGYTLGVMHHQPVVEMMDKDQVYYESNITVSLGGYAAEKMIYGTTTSGVSSDFKHAMQIAKLMVWRVGMGDSGLVGDFHSMDNDAFFLSEDIKKQLGADVSKILQRCLNQAFEILTREKTLLEKMTEALLEKKTLEYDQVTEICKKYGVGKERKIEERGLLQEFHKLIRAQSSMPEKLLSAVDSTPPPTPSPGV